MPAPAFPDCDPTQETFGDLSIKDITQLTYNNSYSTSPTTPKIYEGKDGFAKSSYSKPGELAPQYPTEMGVV